MTEFRVYKDAPVLSPCLFFLLLCFQFHIKYNTQRSKYQVITPKWMKWIGGARALACLDFWAVMVHCLWRLINNSFHTSLCSTLEEKRKRDYSWKLNEKINLALQLKIALWGPAAVASVLNPGTQEAEQADLWAGGQLGLHSKFQSR